MTIDEIKAEVAIIRECRGDDEIAHSREDELHEAVLRAIADGCEDPAGCAAAALETTGIKFARWCA